ncbi:hypothetical protein SAMN05216190_13437 [Pseudomonas borbori]|jgi:hypothetical protein|uniref:Uncharacterized protein n=1 Tax=Pseudomonas borbori TaxID=289003 RepID=A0A1I5VZN0_9PSED|nr:hypothetical protein SAMN05216190_13437 [Pseudomonas borbori]
MTSQPMARAKLAHPLVDDLHPLAAVPGVWVQAQGTAAQLDMTLQTALAE